MESATVAVAVAVALHGIGGAGSERWFDNEHYLL